MAKQKIEKRITTYQCNKTAEGQRVSFAYSQIDGEGNLISTSERGNLIVMDDELQEHIDAIYEFLNKRINND